MKKSNEVVCHIIDWVIAIIGISLSFISGKILVAILILLVAGLLSVILVLVHYNFRLKEEVKKNAKKKEILKENMTLYKSRLETYEKLLNNPYPLYGIVNYIAQNKDDEYKNTSCQLERLCLDVRLVDRIVKNRHNNLQIIWEFSGTNVSEERLDRLYQRIGGDSGTSFDKLNTSVVECFSREKECSDYCESCEDIIPEKCPTNRKMNIEDMKKYSTATYHLLKYDFAHPIREGDSFKIRVKYTWPQCFNPYFDFLLVDPENFAKSIAELSIVVHVDNIIITQDTSVFLCSFNKQSNHEENEGKFEYKEGKYFKIQKKNICQDKMYYVKIMNPEFKQEKG